MATTKENVREKVISMLEDELRRNLIIKLDNLLDSGAIDFDSEDDNYKLPKHIMQVLGNSMSRAYTNPHATTKDKKQVRNLDYFV